MRVAFVGFTDIEGHEPTLARGVQSQGAGDAVVRAFAANALAAATKHVVDVVDGKPVGLGNRVVLAPSLPDTERVRAHRLSKAGVEVLDFTEEFDSAKDESDIERWAATGTWPEPEPEPDPEPTEDDILAMLLDDEDEDDAPAAQPVAPAPVQTSPAATVDVDIESIFEERSDEPPLPAQAPPAPAQPAAEDAVHPIFLDEPRSDEPPLPGLSRPAPTPEPEPEPEPIPEPAGSSDPSVEDPDLGDLVLAQRDEPELNVPQLQEPPLPPTRPSTPRVEDAFPAPTQQPQAPDEPPLPPARTQQPAPAPAPRQESEPGLTLPSMGWGGRPISQNGQAPDEPPLPPTRPRTPEPVQPSAPPQRAVPVDEAPLPVAPSVPMPEDLAAPREPYRPEPTQDDASSLFEEDVEFADAPTPALSPVEDVNIFEDSIAPAPQPQVYQPVPAPAEPPLPASRPEHQHLAPAPAPARPAPPVQHPEPEPEVPPFQQQMSEAERRQQSLGARLRTEFGNPQFQPKRQDTATVFWVSGSHGGSGKTTVTWLMANLVAMAMRKAGLEEERPVWLIEADYSNSKLAQRLNLPRDVNSGRYADYLEKLRTNRSNNLQLGGLSLTEMNRQAIQATIHVHETGLKVVACPYQTTTRKGRHIQYAIQQIVEHAEKEGGYVFIDADTLSNDDVLDLSLATKAHHVILVSDGGHLDDVRRAINTLTTPSAANGMGVPQNKISLFFNETPYQRFRDLMDEMRPYSVQGFLPYVAEMAPPDATTQRQSWVGNISDPALFQKILQHIAEFVVNVQPIDEIEPWRNRVVTNEPRQGRLLGRLRRAGR